MQVLYIQYFLFFFIDNTFDEINFPLSLVNLIDRFLIFGFLYLYYYIIYIYYN